MFLVLRYRDGQQADALVLSVGAGVLRVAIPGCPDTLELRQEQSGWVDENDDCVSIDAIIAEPYQGGFQIKTKYRATADTSKTAPAAMRSMAVGFSNAN